MAYSISETVYEALIYFHGQYIRESRVTLPGQQVTSAAPGLSEIRELLQGPIIGASLSAPLVLPCASFLGPAMTELWRVHLVKQLAPRQLTIVQ